MKLSEDLRSTHSADGAIVLDIRQGQIFRLNPVGSRVLELLKQGHSEQEITTELSRQFNVSPETVAADLEPFLNQLKVQGLVQPQKAEPCPGG
jgi:PqqD family protein of HPr-rel-A system